MTRPTNCLNETPEAQLVGDARNGNRDAIAELFRRHYTHSIAVAHRILPKQEEFLDAVQSAYLSAFRNFQSFRGDASFKTWMTRIVLNQCLMRLREPYRRQVIRSLDEPVPGGTLPVIAVDSRTPEDLALRAEIDRAVAYAVAKLPTALRRRVYSLQCIWSLASRYRRRARPNRAGNENAPVSRPITAAPGASESVRRRLDAGHLKVGVLIVITNRNE
jgi:RNA polymerase sigma-70 factor (ECF subfamily)